MSEQKSRTKHVSWIVLGVSLLLIAIGTGMSARDVVAAAGDLPVLQATSTNGGGGLNFPTATSTQVGGPTATPSRTPTLTPVLAEALGEINLRSGPGLDFDIVGELAAGTTVPIIGRSVRYPWLLIKWDESPTGDAWVYEQLVRVIGDITVIPVIQEPELPTIDPTQASIQETATILLQTPGAAETATATAFFAPTGIYTQTPGGVAAPQAGGATFTPVSGNLNSNPSFPQSNPVTTGPRGPAPGPIIVSLGMMGLLMLGVGLLRRL